MREVSYISMEQKVNKSDEELKSERQELVCTAYLRHEEFGFHPDK